MNRTVLKATEGRLGSAALIGTGVIFWVISLHHAAATQEPIAGRALGVLAAVGLGGPLLAGGLWLRSTSLKSGETLKVVGWSGAGLGLLTVFVSFVVVTEQQHGGRIVEPFAVVLWVAGLGAVGGLLTGVYDIRQSRSDRRQQATADRLSGVIEGAPIPIVEYDPNGTVRRWNEAAERVFGWSAAEVTGDELPVLGQDGGRSEFEAIQDRLERGEQVTNVEIEGRTATGERRQLLFSATPIGDGETETPGSILGTFVDVTERSERKRELRRLREAIDHAGHAIYITDADGTIEYANAAFEDTTGYSSSEVVGEDPSILQSGVHSEEYYRRLWRTITGGDEWVETVVNQRKSGEFYHAKQTIAPIHDGDAISGFVAVQRDTTSKEMREQQLDVLNRVLRHNLRSALHVISGHTDSLRRTVDSDANRRHATKVRRKVDELRRLTERTHWITQTLDSTFRSEVTIPLADVLEEVVEQYSNADITVAKPDEESLCVAWDIKPALEEVLDNAVEHSDRPTPRIRITVSLGRHDGHVSVAVADDGPGIPEMERAALREGSETQLQHGSGLGLWLVKWLTTALGGTVTIEDNDPRGSVVTVTVPRVSPTAETEGREHDSTDQDDSRRKQDEL